MSAGTGTPRASGGARVKRLDDGRWLHTFRQSELEQYGHCAERGRLTTTGQMPRTESDAASIGTACHEGIEYAIHEHQAYDTWPSLDDLVQIATMKFGELAELANFEWKKYTPAAATTFIARAMTAFHAEVMPQMQPVVTEHDFGPLTLVSDHERVIQVKGTIDYVDRTGLWDWKTTSSPYKPWEKQRWAVQPTVYTFAAVQDGLIPPEFPVSFRYVVFLQNGTVQLVDMTRHAGDWEWLGRKCVSIARLLEAELPQFPLVDTHVLCSAKWCGAYPDCKGATRDETDNY